MIDENKLIFSNKISQLIIVLVLMSIIYLLKNDMNKSWYRNGYINPNNTTEFIVNDSIKIKSIYIINIDNIEYDVYKNGKMIDHKYYCFTYHDMHNSRRSLINRLQSKYKKYSKEVKKGKPKSFSY